MFATSMRREATTLALYNQLHQALREARSPISFLRQNAYALISQLLEAHLGDPSSAGPVLEALLQAACWDAILSSLLEGLENVGRDGGPADPAFASPHTTTEQELVSLLSIFQVSRSGGLRRALPSFQAAGAGQGGWPCEMSPGTAPPS